MRNKYNIQPNKLKRLINIKELDKQDYVLLAKRISKAKTTDESVFFSMKNCMIEYNVCSEKTYGNKDRTYPVFGEVVRIHIITETNFDEYITPI